MLIVEQIRQHADFYRGLAASYRAQATCGPEAWREHDAKEAERCEREAEYWKARADRWEAMNADEEDMADVQ